ncbi:hypothetical protein HPB52_018322 [Rhipicephalus sanguineus]|uniref:Uncharacterized protein n=1 Tax=Rhipicephalus sanguineus TaxID=34632 RepID=A0A9D4Q7G6_RHISA|nr:hypothetical protein HPB52_018322 [Rhipicephalus sanguineus]
MSTVAASPRARTRRFKAQLSFGSRSSAQSCLPCNLKANLSELLALLMKPRETVGGGRRRDVPSNATEEIQATPTTTPLSRVVALNAAESNQFYSVYYGIRLLGDDRGLRLPAVLQEACLKREILARPLEGLLQCCRACTIVGEYINMA